MEAEKLEASIAAAGRPRLFFQADGLARLREAIGGTHREKWERLKGAFDNGLDDDPPEYRGVQPHASRPDGKTDEMLWQRVYGYRMPGMALTALLDPDPKYFEAVRRWALTPGAYPLWGSGLYENAGLAAAHTLFGLSCCYDWLYDRWSAEERESLRKTMAEHGQIMHEAATGVNDRGWWKDTWRQNHCWCDYQGIAVTAIALAGDVSGVGEWLALSLWAYDHIFAELPDEGAYEEGIPYWGYAMESLMRFIEAVRPYSDRDYYDSQYLRNTHLFRIYLAGPRIPQVANFHDGLTHDWHGIRPMMYRLASEYRNPLTQWLAENVAALGDRGDLDTTCWDLLWYDPSIAPERPADLPLWHVFPVTGFAGARTSWEPNAMGLYLRSGKANVSHSHLDVNNFILNAGGEYLLRDYGYGSVGPNYFNKGEVYLSTSTWGHNCLVIGEREQRKDRDSEGTITDGGEYDGLFWFRSEATRAYEGAESVVRELTLVKPHAGTGKWGYVVVRDRARTKEPETFDFMLQPGGEVAVSGDGFVIQAEKARLVGRVLAPAGVTMSVSEGMGENVNVKSPRTLRITAPRKAREIEFVVVLVPLAEGEEEPEIAEGVGLRVGADRVEFSEDGTAPPRLAQG